VRALAEDEAAPAHEFEDVVARLHDLTLEGLAAAHQVTDPLIGLGRNVDEHEPIVAEVARDLDGIAAIGLAMLARPARDERGGAELARHVPLRERALEHVAGPGCFVARAGLTVTLEPLEPAADLPES